MSRRRRWRGEPGGIVAQELSSYPLPDLAVLPDGRLPPLLAEVVERAGADYRRWAEQVAGAGYCCRPIRLRGHVDQVDKATGELRRIYSTEGEPNDELLVACGSRRASVCRSCSAWYQGDAFHVVAAGLRGGKGVPESVAAHPKVFVTFTAPSFGAVHAHRERDGRVLPCRPRDRKKTCPHGRPLGCSVRHKADDSCIGEPLCESCFDYAGQVVWNAMAPQLWKRTVLRINRELARLTLMSQREARRVVKVRFAKVAEYQRRGAVHFHAVIRLDAAPPEDGPDEPEPPPERFTTPLLEEAVRAARDSAVLDCDELVALGREDASIRWGAELDVRPLTGGPGELTAEVVAAYVSKYAVKHSVGLRLTDRAMETDEDIDALQAPDHIRSLVATAWVIGASKELAGLKVRQHAHGLGFGGHFLTKSLRYSTTMKALRGVRREFRRRQGRDAVVVDAWGRPEDEDLVAEEKRWRYAGWGFHTGGEAYLAASSAARAREERRTSREECMSQVA